MLYFILIGVKAGIERVWMGSARERGGDAGRDRDGWSGYAPRSRCLSGAALACGIGMVVGVERIVSDRGMQRENRDKPVCLPKLILIIQAVNENGQTFVDDVSAGDVWFFPP